ncbi:Serpentine Receptor, class U [Caenorhabditis elegans]|uniref:Serpentine Receptor, class U n=1 Tax=Caenorhabditis elegans TaxID=6239 RepID=O17080_CAEEL|nr:Serpentine Receptor, class U [Caenorhabditis elegans]CCD67017.1 Serpentine Receptor, class U [Caenorhabditis elegans]|eukprot:NP_503434.2 Serpentine Receptor, class U [Caenorhabditis elegans]
MSLTISPTSLPLLPGIHGNETFINFEFSFFTLPMFLLFLPVIYMPITFIVMLRILVKLKYAMRDKNVNVPLFTAICISQFTCLLFFIFDFVHIRLMTTGIFTSWCASSAPNHYIMALYIATYYVNYANMIFPFLVSTMRLVLIAYPQRQGKINRVILKSALPFISIYPIFFTFFLWPAVGYCTAALGPFPFGSVILGFRESWFGLRNNYFLLFNNLFWLSASLINNSVLLVKLAHLKSTTAAHTRSQKSHKAEVSLTVTTVSMICSYLSNSMIVIAAQLNSIEYSYYAIMLRPFGNDLETCMVSWVFYLTHPVFRRKSMVTVQVSQHVKLDS